MIRMAEKTQNRILCLAEYEMEGREAAITFDVSNTH